MKSFDKRVYDIVREIPKGKVATYGMIAFLLGEPRHSRMVGRALKFAPPLDNIPCYRVVNHQGKLVDGWQEQRLLLQSEGVLFSKNGMVDLKKCLWRL